jgi:hypothetical protein
VGTKIQFGPSGAKMDVNVGKGFENPDPADNATCPAFTALFNEPQYTPKLLDVGTQPCNATAPNTDSCLDFKLYSVYYPANWPSGPIPVLVWGNGTCAQPEGYGPLLRYVASYGFFIVAPNSREVGSGAPQKKAIDFAAAANKDSSSPYFGHLDLSKVGAMGHSQGGQGTAAASADSRVVSAILFNPLSGTASKPFMFVSGDMDIINTNPTAMQTAIGAQSKGAYVFYHNPTGASGDTLKGHLVLMLTPDRVTEQTVAWWQATLLNDPTATAKFAGQNCAFCTHATDYAFGQHGM